MGTAPPAGLCSLRCMVRRRNGRRRTNWQSIGNDATQSYGAKASSQDATSAGPQLANQWKRWDAKLR